VTNSICFARRYAIAQQSVHLHTGDSYKTVEDRIMKF